MSSQPRVREAIAARQREYQALLAEHPALAIKIARDKIPELIYYTGVSKLPLAEISSIVNFGTASPETPLRQIRAVERWIVKLDDLVDQTPYREYPVAVLRKRPHERQSARYDRRRFADLALLEALHENIAILSGEKLIPLKIWARRHGVKLNTALGHARTQRLPAFRQGTTWLLPANTQPLSWGK